MRTNTKTLLLCILTLAFLILFGFFISSYIKTSASKLLKEIDKIEYSISNDNYITAYTDIEKLLTDWEETEKLWSMFVNHHEIDNISITLKESVEYIKLKDKVNSSAYISALRHYIKHIPEIETLSLKNIFWKYFKFSKVCYIMGLYRIVPMGLKMSPFYFN